MPICSILSGYFSKHECEKIIALGSDARKTEGKVQKDGEDVSNSHLRKSQLSWFDHKVEKYYWVNEKIFKAMKMCNEKNWHFQLDGLKEHAQFTRYSDNEYYGWHLDLGDGSTRYRKLAAVIQLNSGDEYCGGNLELLFDGEPKAVPKAQGAMVVFPAYILHRVTPVVKGHRYSLVQWLSGSSPFV